MKLEGRTISILKNFASINPSILFKPGANLRTMSPQKTILAQATIKETSGIPGEFAIYDLSRFLSVLSLFQQPSLSHKEKFVEISDGHQKVNYTYADPSMIVVASEKTPSVGTDVQFTLSADVLSKVQKAMGVLNMPELAVVGDGTNIAVQAIDSRNPSGDSFAINVGTTEHTFRMIFKAENMKIMSADYEVSISFKGLAHFKGEDVEYWIATEASSSQGK
jgi:hypothetical protein